MAPLITSEAPITIIGAGLGGLTLARTLELHKVPYILYEMDPTATSRGFQGGSLDMHPATGTKALKIAQLAEQFNAKCRPEDDCMIIADAAGKIHWQDEDPVPGQESMRPEIDRGVLRKLLLDSINVDNIQWGKKVVRISEEQQGTSGDPALRRVEFADGSSVSSPLVVGADGAWSKVRPLLSDAKPIFTGVYMVEGHIASVNERFPEIASAVPRGTLMALGDGRAMLSQRNGNGSLRTYATIRVAEDWATASGLPFDSDPRAAADAMLETFYPPADGWTEQYRSLLSACAEPLDGASDAPPLVPRPIFALPVDHSWKQTRALTIIGDAAHLMSPFAGEGANLAMLDGAELGEAIARAVATEGATALHLDAEIATFEKTMQERGGEEARGSQENLELFMGPDAARKGGEMFRSMMAMMAEQEGGPGGAGAEELRAKLPLSEGL